jgi:hypothetical protein
MLAASEALSPEQRMLRSMVVEQPHAGAPGSVQHHKAHADLLGPRLQQLQDELVVMRAKCESQEKELAMAARTEAQVLETESMAFDQLAHERCSSQRTREAQAEELKVVNVQRLGLESQLSAAEQRLREAALREEKSDELLQQSMGSLRQEHVDELSNLEHREAEARKQSRKDMENLRHEIEDLRFSADLQKNQLSQSQSLAAELRAEARHLCEERDKNLAEAYAEKVRASQLQEKVSKEQAKLAEAQACSGDSMSSGALIGKLMNSEDRRACSLLTLQQRLQEATLDADRERGNTAEWRRVAEQCKEENAALQRKMQEGSQETVDLATREERYELSQAQALILQLRHELKAERARSHSLEDSLRNEASQMAHCLLASKNGAAKHGAAADDVTWQKELNTLRSELREAECEFHEEFASVRGRLVNADQRNRKLCESLRAAMQVASPPAANAHESYASTAPPSQHLPAPSFSNGARFEEPPRSPCAQHLSRHAAMTPGSAATDVDPGRAGLEFSRVLGTPSGGEHISARSDSYVPRASAKPPRNLQGDYSKFVDWNQRSATDLHGGTNSHLNFYNSKFADDGMKALASAMPQGAMQASVRSSSAAPSPKAEHSFRSLRPSLSQSSLPSRNSFLNNSTDQPGFLLTDVSEGAPELGFGPGGPGASRYAPQSQSVMLPGSTREYLTRGWR